MAYEERNNSGTLFRNDRRQNDRQPEYTGTAIINGAQMRISAWVRTSKNGNKFFSLSFDEPQPKQDYAPKEQKQYAPQKPTAAPAAPQSSDPDLPF